MFSYILGSDDIPFVNNITGEDVNKNIIIAEDIPISPPFGRENLEIFASTFSKNNKCPLVLPKCKINYDGYCVVKGTASKALSEARGLNMSKKKFKIETAENSISWTSFK